MESIRVNGFNEAVEELSVSPKTMETSVPLMSSNRAAGWAAIASGLIGIIGVGYLIAFLTGRLSSLSEDVFLLVRVHDAFVIIQYLLMIRVLYGLRQLSIQRSTGFSQLKLAIGVGAVSFTILFLLLIFPKVLADVLYMFPQGVFGVWLLAVCWEMKGTLSPAIRWFGMVVGLGLALVGTFPPGYAMFVDPILLQVPAPSNEVLDGAPTNTANDVIHLIVTIGSVMGVFTLPFWTILLGRVLLREKR